MTGKPLARGGSDERRRNGGLTVGSIAGSRPREDIRIVKSRVVDL